MPLPTPIEIAQGFESLSPNLAQTQRIQSVRATLVAAAQSIALECGDNRHVRRAIQSIQIAFSQARSSILSPDEP